jgi:hypothetical protein
VNGDFDMKAFKKIPFMMDNVWPSLPKPHGERRFHGKWPRLDLTHPAVKTIPQIAEGVAGYFAATDAETTHLWAWYGGQDICRLHSLWDNDWSGCRSRSRSGSTSSRRCAGRPATRTCRPSRRGCTTR